MPARKPATASPKTATGKAGKPAAAAAATGAAAPRRAGSRTTAPAAAATSNGDDVLLDAWNSARNVAKSTSKTNVPIGNYIGKIVGAKVVGTAQGMKVIFTFEIIDPPEYADGTHFIERWSGPFDDPNNVKALEWFARDLGNLNVDTTTVKNPKEEITQEFCDSLVATGIHNKLAVVAGNNGFNNEYINGPWEDDPSAMGGAVAPVAAADDEVVQDDVVQDDVVDDGQVVIEVNDPVQFQNAAGEKRSGVVVRFEQNDTKVVIRDDETGKMLRFDYNEKIEPMAT
jgi:hypothetical protein